MGAWSGHHFRGRQILMEIRGHQMSKCKYSKEGGINRNHRHRECTGLEVLFHAVMY